LRGGIGVSIVIGSAVLGVIATLVVGHGPGSILGLFIVAGTVAAALVIRPTAVRMLLPVPALCYVIAALAAGLVTDPPSDTSKAALAVAAAQWIAAGFLTMVLATVLAVALTLIRWLLWRRGRPVPDGPVPSAQPASRRKRRVSREDFEDPGPYGHYGTSVNLGSPGATGNYGNYGSHGGVASPGFRNADGLGNPGGLAGQGRFGNAGGLTGQGGFANTGGVAGRGRFGNAAGVDGGGGDGETGGPGGQSGYGNAAGRGPAGRADRWGDPDALDPGGPGSWPDALTYAAPGHGRRP